MHGGTFSFYGGCHTCQRSLKNHLPLLSVGTNQPPFSSTCNRKFTQVLCNFVYRNANHRRGSRSTGHAASLGELVRVDRRFPDRPNITSGRHVHYIDAIKPLAYALACPHQVCPKPVKAQIGLKEI